MDDSDNFPVLISCNSLETEFENLLKIPLSSNEVKFGRCLSNTVVIKFLPISRKHCVIKNVNNVWVIEDLSSFGIKINDEVLGKGNARNLSDGDIICLDNLDTFIYRFTMPDSNVFEIPKKRMKFDNNLEKNIINSMKMKFEASQSSEVKHIEEKIESTKKMQTNSMFLKEKLKLDMDRKIEQLQSDFDKQIENLKGEKNEVEKQKAMLIEEREIQLKNIKQEMEGKISELMEQIKKHNETESELLNENNLLKEKLLKEREAFLSELNRGNTSKQDMMEKLEAKIKEQEETRLREKQELQEQLMRENEILRLEKEKELKELVEQKRQREIELQEELTKIKKHLKDQVELSEQSKQMVEQKVQEKMNEMKKLSDEEKHKMELIIKEREEIQKQLKEAQKNAERSLEELKKRVLDRETELAALAAERIQQQFEQSGEVISTLQEQLEKAKSELLSVEMEKNSLLESICCDGDMGHSSKHSTLNQVGELMESELQCSICAELFVEATTLNCSHTYCKHCITMWKKKKNDCPICRTPIKSECRSLVLDTFIEKMVQNLTEEMKTKRQNMLQQRAELVAAQAYSDAAGPRRGGERDYESQSDHEFEEEDSEFGEEHSADSEDYFSGDEPEYDDYAAWESRGWRSGRYYASSYTDSGSDEESDSDTESSTTTAEVPTTTAAVSTTTGSNSDNNRGRRRGNIPGIPGSFYGGYGRCYSCGASGHWAPGCPFR